MSTNNTPERPTNASIELDFTEGEELIWEGRPYLPLMMRSLWVKHILGSCLIIILAIFWNRGIPASFSTYAPEIVVSFMQSAPWISYALFAFAIAFCMFPFLRQWQYNNTRYIITNKRVAIINEAKQLTHWDKTDFLSMAKVSQHGENWVSLTLWNPVRESATRVVNEKAGLLYIPSDVYEQMHDL